MRPRIVGETDLLDQLLEAFADLGFDGTSVRALCRHLGVSHNLVHQRYQSKDAAWFAAVDHGFGRLTEVLDEPINSAEPFEIMRTIMLRFMDATIEQPALARIIHQEAAHPGPRFDYMFDKYISGVQVRVNEAVGAVQEAGLIRPGPVSTVWFFAVTWGLGGLAANQKLAAEVGREGDDPFEATRLAVEIFLDGLRPPRTS